MQLADVLGTGLEFFQVWHVEPAAVLHCVLEPRVAHRRGAFDKDAATGG